MHEVGCVAPATHAVLTVRDTKTACAAAPHTLHKHQRPSENLFSDGLLPVAEHVPEAARIPPLRKADCQQPPGRVGNQRFGGFYALRLEFLRRPLDQRKLAGVFAALGAGGEVQAQGEAFGAGEGAVGL